MSKLLVLAHSAAPSQCFEMLSQLLQEGHQVEVVKRLGYDGPIKHPSGIMDVVVNMRPDLVLLGMSTTAERSRDEVLAAEFARQYGVPYAFYSDSCSAFARISADNRLRTVAVGAAFVCGVLPTEQDCITQVFPGVPIERTGNPVLEYLAFPSMGRDQVRSLLSIPSGTKLVVAPGGTYSAGNCIVWERMLTALSYVKESKNVQVLCIPHLYDSARHTVNLVTEKRYPVYESLLAETEVSTRLLDPMTMKALGLDANLIATAADVVVEFNGSASYAAAYARVPVISMHVRSCIEQLRRATGLSTIELVNSGVALHHAAEDSYEGMTTALDHLLDAGSDLVTRFRERATEEYPAPAGPSCALTALADVVARHMKL